MRESTCTPRFIKEGQSTGVVMIGNPMPLIHWWLRWLGSKAWVIALGVCLVVAWPGLRLLGPLGINPGGYDPTACCIELGFAGSLLGAVVAVSALEEFDLLAWRLSLAQRLLTQAAALLAGSLGFTVLALAVPFVLGRSGSGVDSAGLWFGALLAHLRLCALGLGVLQLQLPNGTRAYVLFAVAWLLPALLFPRASSALFAVFSDWNLGTADYAVSSESILPLASIIGLFFAANLLASGRRTRR